MTAVPTARPYSRGVVRVVRSVFRSPALRRVMLAFLLFNAMEYATWVAVLLYACDATGPASVGVVALIQLVPSLWIVPVAVVVVGLVFPAAIGVTWNRLRTIDARAHVPTRELALLRRDPVLSPLPAPQLESVARQARWLTFEAGEVIISEGDRGDCSYVLSSGAVRITQADRILRDLAATGDGFGEIALLRDIPRTATATAPGPVVIIALERADFLQAVTGHEQARAASSRIADERYRYLAPAGSPAPPGPGLS